MTVTGTRANPTKRFRGYPFSLLLLLATPAAASEPTDTAIQGWIRALGSPEWREREEATRQLEDAGDRALEVLRAASESGDREVAARARSILDRIDPVEVAVQILRLRISGLREKTIKAVEIAEGRGSPLTPIRIQGAAGEEKTPTAHLVRARVDGRQVFAEVAEHSRGQVIPLHDACLGPGTWSIIKRSRETKYVYLGGSIRSESFPTWTILRAFPFRSSEGPAVAGRLLRELDPDNPRAFFTPRLLAMASDPDPEVRRAAIELLGAMGIPEGREALRAARKEPLLRDDATVALAEIGDQEAVDALLDMIREAPAERGKLAATRVRAGLTLARLGHRRGVEFMSRSLSLVDLTELNGVLEALSDGLEDEGLEPERFTELVDTAFSDTILSQLPWANAEVERFYLTLVRRSEGSDAEILLDRILREVLDTDGGMSYRPRIFLRFLTAWLQVHRPRGEPLRRILDALRPQFRSTTLSSLIGVLRVLAVRAHLEGEGFEQFASDLGTGLRACRSAYYLDQLLDVVQLLVHRIPPERSRLLIEPVIDLAQDARWRKACTRFLEELSGLPPRDLDEWRRWARTDPNLGPAGPPDDTAWVVKEFIVLGSFSGAEVLASAAARVAEGRPTIVADSRGSLLHYDIRPLPAAARTIGIGPRTGSPAPDPAQPWLRLNQRVTMVPGRPAVATLRSDVYKVSHYETSDVYPMPRPLYTRSPDPVRSVLVLDRASQGAGLSPPSEQDWSSLVQEVLRRIGEGEFGEEDLRAELRFFEQLRLREAVPPLRRIFSVKPNLDIAFTLATLGDQSGEEVIRANLEDADPATVIRSAEALGPGGDGALADALIGILTSRGSGATSYRYQALWRLGEVLRFAALDDPARERAIEALVKTLEDKGMSALWIESLRILQDITGQDFGYSLSGTDAAARKRAVDACIEWFRSRERNPDNTGNR